MNTNESRDDDQAWLDALAGRDTTRSPAGREAQTLRLALRRETSAATMQALARRREEALIQRAVDAGLIQRTARKRPAWALPLAAGVLLAFGAGFFLRMQPPPSIVVRGDDKGVVQLTAADPSSLKRALLAELRAAGVDASGYEALGVHGIDAELTLPPTPAVQRVLDKYDIPVPADGGLHIEIRSTE
jgi:hypothetical protein